MADDIDDIKRDADIQRGKEAPENGEALTSEQEILQSIRDTLIAQTEVVEGIESKNLVKVGDVLNNLLSVEQQQLEISRLMLEMKLNELEQADITKLKDLEKSKELLNTFKGIEQSITLNTKAQEEEDGGGGGFLSRLAMGSVFRSLGGGGGIALAALGIGIGLGAILLSFAGAAKIVSTIDGEGIKQLMVGIAGGMAAFETRDLGFLAGMFGVATGVSVLALVSGAKAFGMAAALTSMGIGISGFMLGLGFGSTISSWLNLDYSGIAPAAQLLTDVAGIIAGPGEHGWAILASIIGIAGLFAFATKGLAIGRTLTAATAATIGLGALGIGISAFFMGLGVGDAGLDFMKTDWSSLPGAVTMLTTVAGILNDNEAALIGLGSLTVAAGIFGAAGAKGTQIAGFAAVNMGIIGLGIGQFFAGLAVGDAGMKLMGTKGENFGTLLGNIADGLNSLSGVNAGILFGTMGIFGTIGAVGAGLAPVTGGVSAAIAGLAAVGATTGMGLAGAALGAFFMGFSVVGEVAAWLGNNGVGIKNIMVNMGTGLDALANVDGTRLLLTAGGIAATGPALLAFFGVKGLLGIAGTVGDAFNWVTSGIGKLLGFDDSGKKTEKSIVEVAVEALLPFQRLKAIPPNVLNSIQSMNDIIWSVLTMSDMRDYELRAVYHKNQWLIDQVIQRAQIIEMLHSGGLLSDVKATGPYTANYRGKTMSNQYNLPAVQLKGFINLEGTEEAAEELQKMLNVITFAPTMSYANMEAPLIASGQGELIQAVRQLNVNSNQRSVQINAPSYGSTFSLGQSGGPGS